MTHVVYSGKVKQRESQTARSIPPSSVGCHAVIDANDNPDHAQRIKGQAHGRRARAEMPDFVGAG